MKSKVRTRKWHFDLGGTVNMLILIALAVVMIYPFWYVLIYALSDSDAVATGGLLLWPKEFTLENIKAVINSSTFITSALNSVWIVIVGTTLSVLTTACLAYPLARKVQGAKIINFMIYFTMLFGGGMLPTYYIVRETGLLDSLWSLIIPCLITPFNVFITRTFFAQLPNELVESARIDGASEIRVFTQIAMPLSKPIFATITLFYAVGYWNRFTNAVLYIRSVEKRPLQLLLKELIATTSSELFEDIGLSLGAATSSQSIKMATIIVVALPIILIYPFLQKYFVKGVMLGSVKG